MKVLISESKQRPMLHIEDARSWHMIHETQEEKNQDDVLRPSRADAQALKQADESQKLCSRVLVVSKV